VKQGGNGYSEEWDSDDIRPTRLQKAPGYSRYYIGGVHIFLVYQLETLVAVYGFLPHLDELPNSAMYIYRTTEEAAPTVDHPHRNWSETTPHFPYHVGFLSGKS